MSLAPSGHTKQPDNRTTMDLGAVLPMTAEVRDDHLFVGGVDMVELAHKEGTALYVMDEADLRNRMETYLTSFRSRYENSDIIYASKAFLNKEAARIVAQEGLCLDVSGGGELWCAQQAGFPMERVFVPKSPHDKALQRALIQYRDPKNYELVLEALRRAGRLDLVGYGPKCLIRPYGGHAPAGRGAAKQGVAGLKNAASGKRGGQVGGKRKGSAGANGGSSGGRKR